MSLSYGFIETQGLVGSIEAADAMLKAARVRLIEKREIGFGLVTVVIEGELGAVQAAVDAGSAAAERVGQFITSHVIARPFSDTDNLVKGRLNPTAGKKAKKSSAPKTVSLAQKTSQKEAARPASRKAKTKQAGKQQTEDDALIAILKKSPNGRTLAQLAGMLSQTPKDVRIRLKQFIDSGRVEKVQQRYFLI